MSGLAGVGNEEQLVRENFGMVCLVAALLSAPGFPVFLYGHIARNGKTKLPMLGGSGEIGGELCTNLFS